jgi:hypothetical protein
MHGWNGNLCAVFEAYAFEMPVNRASSGVPNN